MTLLPLGDAKDVLIMTSPSPPDNGNRKTQNMDNGTQVNYNSSLTIMLIETLLRGRQVAASLVLFTMGLMGLVYVPILDLPPIHKEVLEWSFVAIILVSLIIVAIKSIIDAFR